MITQQTAEHIWRCHREIHAAEKLLEDMAESEQRFHDDVRAETLSDAFGRQRNLQLGVPSGESSHRLFDVAPSLARSVIRAHIENKRAELVEANEQARMEIGPM